MLDNECSIGKAKILLIEINMCHKLIWCYECIIYYIYLNV